MSENYDNIMLSTASNKCTFDEPKELAEATELDNSQCKDPVSELAQNVDLVHHLHVPISKPYSHMVQDFDQQYLWDYSDNSQIMHKDSSKFVF